MKIHPRNGALGQYLRHLVHTGKFTAAPVEKFPLLYRNVLRRIRCMSKRLDHIVSPAAVRRALRCDNAEVILRIAPAARAQVKGRIKLVLLCDLLISTFPVSEDRRLKRGKPVWIAYDAYRHLFNIECCMNAIVNQVSKGLERHRS